MPFKPNYGANSSTDLDPVLAGIPWLEGFAPGVGVNALTGALAGNAVKPFTPKPAARSGADATYKFVESSRDLTQEIEASTKGKYNIEGVHVNASAEYINKIKYSETSMTLLATYLVFYGDYEVADKYELTEEAQKLVSEPEKFRARYGDYFVSGVKKMSRFVGIFVCQSSSAELFQSFQASLGAEAPDVFTAEGSFKLSQAAKASNTSIQCEISYVGCSGTPPPGEQDATGHYTPEQVIKALEWFKQNEAGTPLRARLTHYSVIASGLPNTLPVSPHVFAQISVLFTTLWDIRSHYNACPKSYQDKQRKEFTRIERKITGSQSVLPQDPELLFQLQEEADRFLDQLNVILERLTFYNAVRAMVPYEPAEGAKQGENSQASWLFGYSKYPKSERVVINHVEETFAPDSPNWEGWREKTLEIQDQARLIVGWEVRSNWPGELNGSWKKATGHILLTSRAAVYFTSRHWRTCNWTLRVYYVDAKDYQFDPEQAEKPKVIAPINDIRIFTFAPGQPPGPLLAVAARGDYLWEWPTPEGVNAYNVTVPNGQVPPPLVPNQHYYITAHGMPTQPDMVLDHIHQQGNQYDCYFLQPAMNSAHQTSWTAASPDVPEQPGLQSSEEERTLIMPIRAQSMHLKARLQLASGETVLITAEQVLVGRGLADTPEAAAIDLSAEQEKATVSRIHAQMTRVGDHFEIEDRNSSNQTRLNQEILEPRRRYRLSHGDVLEFGKVRCVFNLVGDEAKYYQGPVSNIRVYHNQGGRRNLIAIGAQGLLNHNAPHPAVLQVPDLMDPANGALSPIQPGIVRYEILYTTPPNNPGRQPEMRLVSVQSFPPSAVYTFEEP